MDREQAIKELQESHDIMRNHDIDESESYLMQALNMAIKALEQEPCEDAISRQAVLDLLEDTNNGWIINEVSQLPSVKPQEPKTGHWIFDEILDKHYYCSECKSMGVDYWDFCPYCGAKMVEPQESEG